MSKGLEALEKLCQQACTDRDNFYYLSGKNCKLSEENKEYYPYCKGCLYCSSETRTIIEKELKALEIIKEKACIDMLDNSNNIKGYGLYILSTKLTQEEYDLLKEILL